ncbi:PepSY domain-containing protein [Nonlabens agnitus]|uniref:Peptidase n=1 Tax=Nonlabens agnitus TaxID=870484 RepID=A0A2S9WSJ7_9FLAO|nr:PepSY domain-containing protein [Nonlabens agnitus]PRP66452.1 hypothetical protein BST86_04765 [Nonlabens agnitus]
MGRKTSNKVRMYHRYLGFFLAGIMAVYAISGVALIFRNTDYLKQQVTVEETLDSNLSPEQVGKELKIKDFEASKVTDKEIAFKTGVYNVQTGFVSYTKLQNPYLLDKLQNFHKAKTGQPLYYLNILFGVSLLFFVVSAFWMFLPSTPIFKKGMWFAAAGLVLTLVLLFV